MKMRLQVLAATAGMLIAFSSFASTAMAQIIEDEDPIMHVNDSVTYAVESSIGEQLYGPGDELAVVTQNSWSTPDDPHLAPDKVMFVWDIDMFDSSTSSSQSNFWRAGSDEGDSYATASSWTVPSSDPSDWVSWDLDLAYQVQGESLMTTDYEQVIFWLSSEYGGDPPPLP